MRLKKMSIVLCFLFLAFTCSAMADTVTYDYDEINQLVRVEYSNGTIITYTYDAAGNRVEKLVEKTVRATKVGPWLYLLLLDD